MLATAHALSVAFVHMAPRTPSRLVPPRGIALNSLTTDTVATHLGVELPPLPTGGIPSLVEGFDLVDPGCICCPIFGSANWQAAEVDPSDDLPSIGPDDLDGLLSVGGTVWPCAASICRWLLTDEGKAAVAG